MVKIEVELLSLARQKVIHSNECYIALGTKTLTYVCDFMAEEDIDGSDAALGKQKVRRCFRSELARNSITGAYYTYLPEEKCFRVAVHAIGGREMWHLFFKLRTKADELVNTLVKYMNYEL